VDSVLDRFQKMEKYMSLDEVQECIEKALDIKNQKHREGEAECLRRTRKPCYRNETARCRSFRFDVRRHSLKFKSTKLRKPGFNALDIPAKSRIYRKMVIQGHVF